jgi:quinolinate synthase
VRELKRRFPGVPVVTYVNCYADVKAETDVCCTSSNASRVVEALGSDCIIFLPDEYLAQNVARETGRQVIFPTRTPRPDGALANTPANLHYTLVGWPGRCEVHEKFTVEDITNVRKQFPGVVVLAHPECSAEVVAASDFSGSTTRMIEFVRKSSAPRYLLLTECSMGDNIIAENPDKETVRLCSIRCPHMNEITLEDTLAALRHNRYIIEVPEDIRVRAKRALDRMLEIG